MKKQHDYETTRQSWNKATKNHNSHKGDQAAFFRAGGDTLFPEEVALLGDIRGKSLVHLQCNAGQDSLSLAKRGAKVTGVDFSEEAIGFAKTLSENSGIGADFELAEVVEWLEHTDKRFDIAFASYGATCWLPDIEPWAKGIYRILNDGGWLTYVEFHPLLWCFTEDIKPMEDSYFDKVPYNDPVGDYVALSGAGLLAEANAIAKENEIPAISWQHGFAEMIDTIAQAGFRIERAKEYPYSNGCRILEGLVETKGRRFRWPDGIAEMPLMYGIRARKEG